MIHDVIIIGSGPSGLTAGMYLGRFKRKPLIIDGDLPGGQLMTTGAVENWPGEVSIDGPELMAKLKKHAQRYETFFLADTVVKVDFSKQPFELWTKNNGRYEAKSVIIATGSCPRVLGCPGEKEYWGRGVNVCATCDAPLYKNRNVVVVGGGNSAIAESFALSKHAKQVTILQLHDHLSATDPLKDVVLAQSNVKVLYNQKVLEVLGNGERVTGVLLEDQKSKIQSLFSTEGVFIAIGMVPNSKIFKGNVKTDSEGYILCSNGFVTSQPGVFVAGDVTDRLYRQAIMASGQGCAAALECERWLRSL